jgi:hypothetical protein
MTNIFKQVGKTAKEAAKDVAKKMASEPAELLRNAKVQVVENGGNESQKAPEISLIDEIITGDRKHKDPTETEKKEIEGSALARLSEIEAQLDQIRMEKVRQAREWSKAQDSVLASDDNKKDTAFVMPGKPRHGGAGGAIARKKGTKEITRQHSG